MMSWFTKDMDLIDFFTVILAVHVGGLFAGTFGWVMMVFSRFFGPTEDMDYTIKDAFAFFFGGLLTPVFYALTNQNLLITMYLFTLIGRYGVYLLEDFIFTPGLIWRDLGLILAGVPLAYFTNTILVSLFGESLDRLFETGLRINFGLLFFVTAGLVGFFVLSRVIERGERDTKSSIKKHSHYQASIYVDPLDTVMDYFDIFAVSEIITGSFSNFKLKIFLSTFFLMSIFFLYKDFTFRWYQIIFLIVVLYIFISGLIWVVFYLMGDRESRSHPK
tara:strand:- start:14703 stop:15527 length:825 start_codon:yes stop_codon:yes gene_type:complete